MKGILPKHPPARLGAWRLSARTSVLYVPSQRRASRAYRGLTIIEPETRDKAEQLVKSDLTTSKDTYSLLRSLTQFL